MLKCDLWSECIDTDKEILSALNVNIFLPIYLNIGLGCSKELSHWEGSFEYQQHIFWMRNEENNFQYACLYGCLWLIDFLEIFFLNHYHVSFQSVFNGMHVIFIPYSLMKVDPASWMKMITKYKGESSPPLS